MKSPVEQRGFTLIELLVVISIISLLSSTVFASLNSAREKARLAGARQFSASTQRSIGSHAVLILDLDEGSGSTANDRSGNNYHSTIGGATWSTDTYSGFATSRSLVFSAGNFITVPRPLGISNTNFTVSMWIKTTSNSGQMYVLGNAGSGDGYRFGLSGGSVAFLLGNGGYTESQCGTKTVHDGKWHHIAGVFDRTNLAFYCYVDGQAAGSVPLGSSFLGSNDAAPQIGAPVCCVPFSGSLDEIKVYTVNLSGASIEKMYAEERSKFAESNDYESSDITRLHPYRASGRALDHIASVISSGF